MKVSCLAVNSPPFKRWKVTHSLLGVYEKEFPANDIPSGKNVILFMLMHFMFCSRCIPRNYQTKLIVNPSALKQPRSCSISSESAWSNYATTETFLIICHHTTPATYTGTCTKPAYAIWDEAWKLYLASAGVIQTVWNEAVTPESLRSRVSGKKCKWHIHPRASNKFLRSGGGQLISPLSSMTGLWGVICKYGSVMNLFSFSKPSCCLLNHMSTWATILSPTAALALKLWTT